MGRAGDSVVVVIGVVVMTMVGVGLAAVPGPKDRRYPDNIVDPRVRCEKEGSFPHPRNCSWYYRCVDRMSTGFFFTYYYECEPGTVFSDDLDQCVFPFLINPPCGTNGTGPAPPPGPVPGPVPPVLPGPPGTTSPPTIGTTDSTPGTTKEPATPTPTPGTGQVTCRYTDDTCQTLQICSPERRNATLCTACYIGPLKVDISLLCPGNKVRDRDTNQCVDRPKPSELCSATTTTTEAPPNPVIDIGTTNTITCSEQDPIPDAPWIISQFCRTYAFCKPGGRYWYQAKLCDSYYMCTKLANGTWTTEVKSCEAGELFAYSYRDVVEGCVPEPTADELC